MRVNYSGDKGVEVVLSRRNLESLLRGLNDEKQTVQLIRRDGAGYLFVIAEDDAEHYAAEAEHIIA